jgi:sugar/nucleoside kinase (ribokinase family)
VGAGREAIARVLVVGDVLTDVVVTPSGPIAPGTDTTAEIVTRPGGAAANAAAWLGRLGAPVALVARVAADSAAWHEAALRDEGVDPRLAVDPAAPTGVVVVLVAPGGERTMLTQRGASLALAPGDLPADGFRAGDVLHLSGYALLADGPRPAALAALERARAVGMAVSVDPASVGYLQEAGPARFLDWTAGAQVCFPNLDEGRVLTGAAEPAAVAAALLAHYEVVVLKLGAGGALQAARGAAPLALPAPAVVAVDATGAGDAFAAGWLAAWGRGLRRRRGSRRRWRRPPRPWRGWGPGRSAGRLRRLTMGEARRRDQRWARLWGRSAVSLGPLP